MIECWPVFLSLIVRTVAVLGAGLMGAGIGQVSYGKAFIKTVSKEQHEPNGLNWTGEL